jgi:hypothetical protein
MRTVAWVKDRDELVQHLRKVLEPWPTAPDPAPLTIQKYYPDKQVGWPNCHIVVLEGYGVLGYTDGPVK